MCRKLAWSQPAESRAHQWPSAQTGIAPAAHGRGEPPHARPLPATVEADLVVDPDQLAAGGAEDGAGALAAEHGEDFISGGYPQRIAWRAGSLGSGSRRTGSSSGASRGS